MWSFAPKKAYRKTDKPTEPPTYTYIPVKEFLPMSDMAQNECGQRIEEKTSSSAVGTTMLPV